jgi:hypothetical protein
MGKQREMVGRVIFSPQWMNNSSVLDLDGSRDKNIVKSEPEK